MYVARLILEKFRGIDHLEVDFSDFTVLIGENNSGKSSILDALRICVDKVSAKRGYVFRQEDFQPTREDIVLTCTFCIPKDDPDEAAFARKLSRVINVEAGHDEKQVVLQVTGTWNEVTGQASHSPVFLNPKGEPHPQRNLYEALNGLNDLVTCKMLHANRSASHDFRPTAQFLGPILDATTLEAELASEIEEELDKLGERLVGSSTNLKCVVDELLKLSTVTDVDNGVDAVRVSPLPPSVKSLLQRTEVRIKSRVGTELPISMHGAGTQSMAAFFLFSAFTKLARQTGHVLSVACIEEPEAHLHPWAVSSAATTVAGVADQVVASTHSGDLVGETPLHGIRRIYRKDRGHFVGSVPKNSLSTTDERKLNFHVFSQRGQVLFGRLWLLVEGESEFHVLPPIAKRMSVPFTQLGVYVIQYAQIGVEPLVRLADYLGIGWHVLADGDTAGDGYAAKATPFLNGRQRADHITQWTLPDIESVFWENGFDAYYEGICPEQALNSHNGIHSPEDRRKAILKSGLKAKSKPGAAHDVVELLRTDETKKCPKEIEDLISCIGEIAKELSK